MDFISTGCKIIVSPLRRAVARFKTHSHKHSTLPPGADPLIPLPGLSSHLHPSTVLDVCVALSLPGPLHVLLSFKIWWVEISLALFCHLRSKHLTLCTFYHGLFQSTGTCVWVCVGVHAIPCLVRNLMVEIRLHPS